MNKIEILAKINIIFNELFQIDNLSLETELESVGKLDSLGKLNLFLRIEKEFGMKLSMSEIIKYKTINDIAENIQAFSRK
jgi:acyl carrier protein